LTEPIKIKNREDITFKTAEERGLEGVTTVFLSYDGSGYEYKFPYNTTRDNYKATINAIAPAFFN